MGDIMPPEMMVLCLSCGGEKLDYATTVSEPCEECEGAGELAKAECDICFGEGCPRCFGEGYFYDLLCPVCDGYGEVEKHPKCSGCRGTGWHPHLGFEE